MVLRADLDVGRVRRDVFHRVRVRGGRDASRGPFLRLWPRVRHLRRLARHLTGLGGLPGGCECNYISKYPFVILVLRGCE